MAVGIVPCEQPFNYHLNTRHNLMQHGLHLIEICMSSWYYITVMHQSIKNIWTSVSSQGGSVRQIACELINLIKVCSSSRKHSVPPQLILKHAYTLDVFIYHIVHMIYLMTLCQFSETLKKYLSAENLKEVQSSFLTKIIFWIGKVSSKYFM